MEDASVHASQTHWLHDPSKTLHTYRVCTKDDTIVRAAGGVDSRRKLGCGSLHLSRKLSVQKSPNSVPNLAMTSKGPIEEIESLEVDSLEAVDKPVLSAKILTSLLQRTHRPL